MQFSWSYLHFCKAYRSLLNSVSYVPCVPAWSTCQYANVLKACQLLIFTCQRANVPINAPKVVQVFQTFLLRNAQRNFYTLLLVYKKLYIIFDIIVIHMICVCIVHENCIILHFYTSSHIKGKCLFFENFLFFISK